MTTMQTIGKKRETQELLDAFRSIMDYDPNTGKLTYKVYRSSGAKVGDEPGRNHLCRQGYKRLSYQGKQYSYHRICWALYYGRWPENTIHHKDNDPTNNRIENLADVTQAENNKYKKPYKGRCLKGVYKHSQTNNWRVVKDTTYYGSYKCFGKAYKKAKEVFTNT